jgi:F-type H+-transporting ATPase subunit b
MLIDWFTVGAQILNFIILVWLLRRFLYRPILAAIDARDKAIAKQVSDAAEKMAAAEKQLSAVNDKLSAFQAERAKKQAALDQDIKDAREKGFALLEKDSDTARRQHAESIRSADAELGAKVSSLVAGEVFELARKALAQLANTALESQMVGAFLLQLKNLDQEHRSMLSDALVSQGKALVRSAFVLGQDDQKALQASIDQLAGRTIAIQFEVSPDDVCGIDLSCNGQRAEWTIGAYLKGINSKVTELLDQDGTSGGAYSDGPAAPAVLPDVPPPHPAAASNDPVAVA